MGYRYLISDIHYMFVKYIFQTFMIFTSRLLYLKFLNIVWQVVWIFPCVYYIYIFNEKIATSINQIAVPHNNIY